ncbi:hydrolase, HD family [Leptospira inadai serovar Lyme str. 10]|uniref:bis(5'-nucleosyl)-tetraphosphatase (symmetrical) n=2 Tax=Leptospira inadai serovar Lyme TaxID=293084 RepID=V6HVI2_9LEPT|nr:bis(5'-nucleosyl)-tetraphosphatase (symmetrical) YqeK [Leptospira inadai]EQA36854.1 hydrolase, HD family [Leptospira inadai serovar Lyme str. 10]PNV74487.1 HD domain-containing protein [Leptospira inadai serovar Lyme]
MIPETTDEQIKYFMRIVPDEITVTRWEHSLRVAEIAKELAGFHAPDQAAQAFLAGIVHDITKQKTKEFHLSVFTEADDPESADLPEAAWHSRSAYHYLKRKYGLLNESVLGAVKHHTLGGEDLSVLECVLYAADFLGSEFAERQKEYADWREETRKDLYKGVLNKAFHTISDLLENRREIHPLTIGMYHSALRKLTN